ncbi:MAG TPA: TRL domain-containing protein [Myxococcota bacterium]|nr:TRL domain-containing protein [Myxococcota bacterium]
MKRSARVIVAVAALVSVTLTSGCVYMNVTTPLDTDLDQTKLGTKTGKSEAQMVLGLVAWGDAGTQAAAKNGNITVLRGADQETFSILGPVYARWRTVVYGD